MYQLLNLQLPKEEQNAHLSHEDDNLMNQVLYANQLILISFHQMFYYLINFEQANYQTKLIFQKFIF